MKEHYTIYATHWGNPEPIDELVAIVRSDGANGWLLCEPYSQKLEYHSSVEEALHKALKGGFNDHNRSPSLSHLQSPGGADIRNADPSSLRRSREVDRGSEKLSEG